MRSGSFGTSGSEPGNGREVLSSYGLEVGAGGKVRKMSSGPTRDSVWVRRPPPAPETHTPLTLTLGENIKKTKLK